MSSARPTLRITRRYRFSAGHVLRREAWSEERNRAVYGRCANPNGHGHGYGLEVTLRGEPDPETGQLLPPARLDRVVEDRVLRVLDHRLLNRDVAAFEKQVPTAENIARFVWRALAGRLAPAALDRIRLVETDNNSVEYRGELEED
ncbi:MAG: 6-carboxytetrahydropterin synthase [Myxococcales bacterium]|nr:6-carboxytetrahydropterin synthase [Myxococcales bacterium]